jgi:hypothetical protein
MSINRSSSSSNQQKVGSQLIFAILPAYSFDSDVIPPTGSSNFSSPQPVTIADSQVSINITCVDTVNTVGVSDNSTIGVFDDDRPVRLILLAKSASHSAMFFSHNKSANSTLSYGLSAK